MRIIFICHYFPPQDNVGVRRVSFWANFFSEEGHEVTVVTTKKNNSENLYKVIDTKVKVIEYGFFSLNEVSRTNVVEKEFPQQLVPVDKKHSSNSNNIAIKILLKIKRRIVNPILGQLIDHRLFPVMSLIVRSKLGMTTKYLGFLKSSEKTIFISTVPPWPSHLLGVHFSKKYKHALLADYRDPFSNNHVFSSKFSFIEERIDRWVANNSYAVITVSPSWQNYYRNYKDEVLLLRNGFDEKIFDLKTEVRDEGVVLASQDTLILSYFGTIENYARMPLSLLEFLKTTKKNIIIKFFGSCGLIEEYVDQHPVLKNKVKICGTVSYLQASQEMKRSMINLVAEAEDREAMSNRGLIPTKVYEYLAALRPIIAVVNKNSDMVEILTKSGLLIHTIDGDIDYERILDKENLKKITISPDVEYISSLSRQRVAKDFYQYLKNI